MVDSSLNMTLGQGIDLPRVDPALDYQKREMEQTMVLKDREVEQAIVLQDREVEQAMVLQNMELESEEVTSIRVSVIKTNKRANPEEDCRPKSAENFRHIFIYQTMNFHFN